MKSRKHLLWLPVVAALMLAASNQQVRDVFTPATPVEKSVSFALYKGGDYASEVYSNTSAQVHITIEKVSGKKRTKVWEKTFDAQNLKQYPTLQQAMAQTVKVPNVFDEKEHLEVSYTLTYNSRGSQLQMQNGVVVSGSSKQVNIGI